MKVIKTIAFWLVSCTWGCVMTSIGAVVALVMLITGHRPRTYGPCIYFEVGYGWGGCELGAFFVCSRYASDACKSHEVGHAYQNLLFGPLMPFLVSLPSAFRYWMRNFSTHDTKTVFSIIAPSIAIIAFVLPKALFGNDIVRMIGVIESVYLIILTLWMVFIEIPQYESTEPLYDSIWFEGQATRIGRSVTRLYEVELAIVQAVDHIINNTTDEVSEND